jgi:hypothetical protein
LFIHLFQSFSILFNLSFDDVTEDVRLPMTLERRQRQLQTGSSGSSSGGGGGGDDGDGDSGGGSNQQQQQRPHVHGSNYLPVDYQSNEEVFMQYEGE